MTESDSKYLRKSGFLARESFPNIWVITDYDKQRMVEDTSQAE